MPVVYTHLGKEYTEWVWVHRRRERLAGG